MKDTPQNISNADLRQIYKIFARGKNDNCSETFDRRWFTFVFLSYRFGTP